VVVGLAAKLQLKPGQSIAFVDRPGDADLGDAAACPTADPEQADAVVVFAADANGLNAAIPTLSAAADRGALTWVAYPKAGALGTDLNRDRVRAAVNEEGLDTVRQVPVDDTWSALRLRSA
jgi:hypothetical protein